MKLSVCMRALARRVAVAFSIAGVSAGVIAAGDPVAGAALYINPNGAPLGCAAFSCHGPDPSQNISSIRNGANNPTVVQNAIDRNVGGMGFLKPYLSTTDVTNLAAYIANPNAGTAAPAISVSTASLSFGNQVIATRSGTMTVTVSNTGSASLSLTNLAIGGANGGEFDRAGTCSIGGSVAAGSACTIAVGFTPQALGTRTGALTITHNATGGTSAVGLTGVGASAAGPAVSLSATSLASASQAVGTVGAAQTLTLTNSGVSDLSISGLALAGANPGDWRRAGSCAVGGTVAARTSCTITLAFAPTAAGARAAQLRIDSNAPGSPHAVSITGTASPAVTPVAAVSTSMLLFGNYVVGTMSTVHPVTLTNTGSAVLSIGGMSITGPGFAQSSTCGASLAPSGNCTINVTYTPTSTGAASGTLSIQTNAPGSPHAVGLSGNGIAAGTALPSVALTPTSLAFSGQVVNTTSPTQTVSLTNTGSVALNISAFTLTGTESSDFARSGTCTVPGTVAAGANCTIQVAFTPTASGTRHGDLNLISNAAGSPTIALGGTGTTAAVPGTTTSTPASSGGVSGGTAATNVGNGGCSIGTGDEFDPLWALLLLAAACYVFRDRKGHAREITDHEHSRRFS